MITASDKTLAPRIQCVEDPAAALPDSSEISLLEVSTLVLWSSCALFAVAGALLSYSQPKTPPPAPPPVGAELLKVELTESPVLETAALQTSKALELPPRTTPVSVPNPAPDLVPLASPQQVNFAVPVADPPVVPVARINPIQSASTPVNSASSSPAEAVRKLTYGEGEGRQPAPDYPARARRQGEQGTVAVRFTVAEDGRVLQAEAVQPSPWPLLNEAALRVIRERWRFHPGVARVYEVSIRFQLTN
jgi:protein TonB